MVSAVSYLAILKAAMPETILVLTALVVLAADLGGMRHEPPRNRRVVAALLSAFGCVAAGFWIFNAPDPVSLLDGMLVIDPVTRWVRQVLLALALLTALCSVDFELPEHAGEYFALLLFATVGLLLLVSAEELLMIFVALELTSLSLYILTAFSRSSPRGAEAALKYYLFGGLAAAFTLFGLSLVYGVAGATNLRVLAARLGGPGLDPLLAVALVMVVIGFGFKIAAVPFHLWAPDVYQGAPTPSAALIASGSKVASFYVLAKVMMLGFGGVEGSGAWRALAPGWVPVLALLAAASMILGNLAAIVQGSVKRLLAYSAIAHAGYLLLGIMANDPAGTAALLYYAATYALAAMGAFGVVLAVETGTGGDRLTDFAGLSRRAPVLAFCMLLLLLSLAGIPPLAGFFGKFYLFAAVADAGPGELGMLWLVGLAIAMSAVSLYYYLQVLKQIYVVPPGAEAGRLGVGFAVQGVALVAAGGVLVLGCWPDLLLGRLAHALGLLAH